MFDAYVAFQARVRPATLALITPERWATYAELDADVDRLAAGLRELGVAPASGVVANAVQGAYLQHVALLALARLGVVSSPFDDPAPDLRLVGPRSPGGARELVLTGDWLNATLRRPQQPSPPVRGAPDSIVRVMLSSGTTRVARRVARTWLALEGNTRTAALTYLAGKTGSWVSMTGLDTGLGQAMTLAAWAQGATLVAAFDVERLLASLDAIQPSIIGLTPNHLRLLLAGSPAGVAVRPGLRLAVTGGVLPPALALEARLRLSSDILISYGATESGSATMADGAWLERFPRVAGYPVPGVRIEVVDEDGRPVAAGEEGEVRIVSDRASSEYIGYPEATAAAFRDGAFYSGDLGRLTPDGLLLIDGRKDDRMDLGGFKFMPALVEEVALSCPGVIDVAAFAAPDAAGMDNCWLAVVADDGFDRQQLAARLAVASHALPPVRFAWTQEIPRNAAGKVERRRLREETLAVLRALAPDSAPPG